MKAEYKRAYRLIRAWKRSLGPTSSFTTALDYLKFLLISDRVADAAWHSYCALMLEE